MDRTGLVQFSDDQATYTSQYFDGYLAFLPEPEWHDLTAHDSAVATDPDKHLSYRYFSGKEFCWFEFKNTKLSVRLSLQMIAPHNYLWLLINMRTGISLALDSVWLVPTDKLLCYQTFAAGHSISLTDSSTWFMLLGIDGHILRELMAEYTQLPILFTATTLQDSSRRVIGTMNLHARLKRVLDGLQQMEFRPFSTYYQLANWNTRFFQHVFQEIEAQATEKTDHEIELYHKAIAYIRQNFYDDQINIGTIAKALHISESTLKRAFKDKPFTVTGQIIEFRLQKARELIRNTDRSISRIASALNFACTKNFKRLFTKRFMISPLEYRDRMTLKRLF